MSKKQKIKTTRIRNHCLAKAVCEGLESRRLLAFGSNVGDLFLSGQHSGLILDVDPSTGSAVNSVPAFGGDAAGMRFGPNGNLYCLHWGGTGASGSLEEYDGTTGAHVATIASAIVDPYGLVIANNLFYVSESLGQRVQAFNADGQVVYTIASPDFVNLPLGMAVSSTGRLLVGTRNGDQIDSFGLDGSSPSVFAVNTKIKSTFGLAFGPNGNLYASNAEANTIEELNGVTGALVTTIAGGNLNAPLGIAFDPATGDLYAANGGNNSISEFNGSTGSPINTFTGFPGVYDIAFRPFTATATGNNSAVTFRWNGMLGATYSIFRGTTPGGEQSTPLATNLNGTTYIDNTALDGTTYYYTVTGQAGATIAHTPEVSATPIAPEDATTIAALAGALGDSPIAMYNWVYDNITYEVYGGLMKGAQATLETRAGNDWDQAALLIQLLQDAGYNAQFAYGTVQLTATQLKDWLDFAEPAQAVAAFNMAGVSAAIVNNSTDTAVGATLSHAWVSLNVGGQTIALDPCFKFSAFSQSVYSGYALDLPFDEGGYLATPPGSTNQFGKTNELPYQYFEDQLSQAIRPSPSGSESGSTLADVGYDGPILIQDPAAFTAALPYPTLGAIATYASIASVPASLIHTAALTFSFPGSPLSPFTYSWVPAETGPNEIDVTLGGALTLSINGSIVTGPTIPSSAEVDVSVSDSFLPNASQPAQILNRGQTITIAVDALQFSDAYVAAQQGKASLQYIAAVQYEHDVDYQQSTIADLTETVFLHDHLTAALVESMGTVENKNVASAVYQYVPTDMQLEILSDSGAQVASLGADNFYNVPSALQLNILTNAAVVQTALPPVTGVVPESALAWYQQYSALSGVTQIKATNYGAELAGIFPGYTNPADSEAAQEIGRELNAGSTILLVEKTNTTSDDLQVAGIAGICEVVAWQETTAGGDVHYHLGGLTSFFDTITTSIPSYSEFVGSAAVANQPNSRLFHGPPGSHILTFNPGQAPQPTTPTNNDPNQTYANDVDVASGDVSISATDIQLPAVGEPLTFARTYNAITSNNANSSLGPGWSFTDGDTIVTGQGPNFDTVATMTTGQGQQFEFWPITHSSQTAASSGLEIFAVASQADGSIVVAGDDGGNLELYQFTPGGTQDVTFLYRPLFTSPVTFYGGGMAIAPDGTIYVSGTEYIPDNHGTEHGYGLVAAFASNGATLGSGYVYAPSSNLSSDTQSSFTTLAIASNGDVVVGGEDGAGQFIAEFRPWSGDSQLNLDPNFGQTGITSLASVGSGAVSGIAVQSNSNIDVAVRNGNGNGGDLLQLTGQGDLSSTFGSGGIVPLSENLLPTALTLQPDGSIIVGGYIFAAGLTVVERYLPTGSLDGTFGTGGVASLGGSATHFINSLAVETGGIIVVGGSQLESGGSLFSPTLAALEASGTIDSAFGNNGTASGPPSGQYSLGPVTLATDGTLIQPEITTGTMGSTVGIWEYNGTGGPLTGYRTPAGIHGTLVGSALGGYQFYGSDGSVKWFTPADGNGVSSLVFNLDRNGNGQWIQYTSGGSISSIQAIGVIGSTISYYGRVLTFTYNSQSLIASIIDGTGRVWTYSYTNNLLTQVQLSDNGVTLSTTQYGYDSSGRLISGKDADGHTTSFSYYSDGRSFQVIDPVGNVFTAVYDIPVDQTTIYGPDNETTIYQFGYNGQLTTKIYPDQSTEDQTWVGTNLATDTDPNGYTTSDTYDYSGNLVKVVDGTGSVTVTTFNQFAEPLLQTDPRGFQTRFTYDAHGNLLSITTPDSDVTAMTYDVRGQELTIKRPSGNTTTFTYNRDGQVLTEISALGYTTSYTYDSQGHQASFTDPLKGVTLYTYNGLNQLVATIDPLNNKTINSFDALGNLVAETDALGRTTSFSYDADNRLLRTTYADGSAESILYGAGGDKDSTTNADGAATFYAYDLRERNVEQYAPNGGTTLFEYDGDGRVIAAVDPDGNVWTTSYDGDGRVIESVDGSGHPIINSYDASGNLVLVRDVIGYSAPASLGRLPVPVYAVTSYQYDAANRVTKTTDPTGATTTYAYDADGNITLSTDPLAKTTTYGYDAQDRKTSITDTLGNTTRTVYDADNNVIKVTDPLQRSTIYGFDADNRVTQVTDPMGGNAYMLYDAVGNVIKKIDPAGHVTTYGYDRRNRQTIVTDALERSTTTSYDAAGNVTRVVDPLGNTTKFAYDAMNRLTAVIDPQGNEVTRAYDSAGNLTLVTDALHHATTYGYDGDGRQTLSIDAMGDKVSTTYDGNGNVIQVVDSLGNRTTYSYDADNRRTLTIDPLGSRTTTQYDADGNMVKVIDPLNHATTYSYDADNRRTLTIDPLGSRTTTQYDADGNMVKVIDPLNHATTYSYDADNRRTLTIDPLGSRTTTQYDADGNVVKVIDPLNHATSYGYDADNRRTLTIDPLGSRTTTQYDADGNMVKVIDPLNHATTYSYDADNRRTLTIDPLGSRTTTQYDADGNMVKVIDPLNHATSYGYDADNRRTLTIDPLGSRTTTQYDADGNVVKVIDPLNHATSYGYDADNRRTLTIDPLGSRTTTQYDADGNVVKVIDPLNHATSYGYDADNRRTLTIDPLGSRTTTQYDADGNVVKVIDPLNHATTYSYDADNRRTLTIDPLGSRTTTQYDADGNVVKVIDPLNHATSYGYDADNRRTLTIDPLGSRTTTQYDADGNVVKVIDPLNHATSYGYDADNRRTLIVDALGHKTSTVYDALGNVVKLTDADGNVTLFSYDSDGRELRDTNALGATESFTYDADGNELSDRDSDGRLRTFTYDADNRQLTEAWLNSSNTPIEILTDSYNGAGQLVKTSSPAATYAFTYDADGRLLTQDNAGSPATSPHTVLMYAYDASGNRVLLADSIGGAPGAQTTYAYDADNRLIQETQNGGGLAQARVNLFYNAVGEIISELRYTNANGTGTPVISVYGYDANSDMLSSIQSYNGKTLSNYSWVYNAAGLVTTQTGPDGVDSYTYDATNQEIAVKHTGSEANEAFSFDSDGNRDASGAQVGKNNEVLNDGTYTYTYDANGNRLTRADKTGNVTYYSWDYRNELVSIVEKNAKGVALETIQYTYDSLGNRIAKSITTGTSAPVITRYTYDGQELFQAFSGAGKLTDQYINGVAVNQHFADDAVSNGDRWLIQDSQGTVRDVISSSGVLVDHLGYNSFGVIVSQTNSSAAPAFGYTGQQTDPESGLDYYRARYYDPRAGSFLSEDPTGFSSGDDDLYRYVYNSPANAEDPTGQSFLDTIGNAISSGVSDVGNAINGAINDVGSAGETVYNDVLEPVGSFIVNSAESLAEAAYTVEKGTVELGESLFDAAKAGVEYIGGNQAGAAADWQSAVSNAKSGVINYFNGTLAELNNPISEVVGNALTAGAYGLAVGGLDLAVSIARNPSSIGSDLLQTGESLAINEISGDIAGAIAGDVGSGDLGGVDDVSSDAGDDLTSPDVPDESSVAGATDSGANGATSLKSVISKGLSTGIQIAQHPSSTATALLNAGVAFGSGYVASYTGETWGASTAVQSAISTGLTTAGQIIENPQNASQAIVNGLESYGSSFATQAIASAGGDDQNFFKQNVLNPQGSFQGWSASGIESGIGNLTNQFSNSANSTNSIYLSGAPVSLSDALANDTAEAQNDNPVAQQQYANAFYSDNGGSSATSINVVVAPSATDPNEGFVPSELGSVEEPFSYNGRGDTYDRFLDSAVDKAIDEGEEQYDEFATKIIAPQLAEFVYAPPVAFVHAIGSGLLESTETGPGDEWGNASRYEWLQVQQNPVYQQWQQYLKSNPYNPTQDTLNTLIDPANVPLQP